jgi:hypothetical protein
MKKSELHFLYLFYNHRMEKGLVSVIEDDATDSEFAEYARACRNLRDSGLIEWLPVMGLPIGLGKITTKGVLAVETNAVR